MKPEELSEALGQIDGHYINEAMNYKRSRLGWIPWTAACAVLAVLWTMWSPLSGWHPYDPGGSFASYYARGVPLSVPLVADGGEGLIVNSVRIRLDIQEYPSFPDLDSYLNFDSTTNMELELCNPGEKPISVNLLLPCGTDPLYAYNYDPETDATLFHAARERYTFQLNGEPLDAILRVRNSNTPPAVDDNWSTRYVTADTVVTKYTCRITELEDCENPLAAIWGPGQHTPIRGLLEKDGDYRIINGNFRTVVRAAIGDELVIYIVGDAPDYRLGWHFVSGHDKKTPIEGAVELTDTQVMTFREFARQSFPEDWGISEADWACAMAENLSAPVYYGGNSPLLKRPYRWYQTELTIPSGDTVTLSISLPLYPDSYLSDTNDGFSYKLDLSSLRALDPQGEQTLTLDTLKAIAESTAEFTVSGTQYTLDLSDLSGPELSFALSRQRSVSPYSNYKFLWIPAALGGVVGFLLWYLIRRRKA